MILGVVLAGGKSSRFGSDKAIALLAGKSLIAHAVDTLSGWCEYVIVAGRETAPAPTVPDWPHEDTGPLGGIAAALHHAQDEGYDSVLSCAVDALGLPENLPELLDPAPAFLADQPVVGIWPVSAAPVIERILRSEGSHSMRAFAQAIGAREVKLLRKPDNINTPADLAAAEARHEL